MFNTDGILDFTDGMEEHNHVTCALPFENSNDNSETESLHVCMNPFHYYISSPYFYVRLQIYYNEGKRFFYTTGIIHPTGYYIQNEVMKIIARYCLPLVNLVPMDSDGWKHYRSKLAMYGYNAKKNELSNDQRRNIINFVLDHHYMSDREIVNYLQRNIDYTGDYRAKDIWRSDIQYVEQYNK